MRLVDVSGSTFDFYQPPERVVSLVPSLTESLFAIGAGDSVVGITDFCIFPPGLDRPRVGGTKNPRIAEIRSLSPDLVYVNQEENLRRHAEEIARFARVFVTEPKSVHDVAELIRDLGSIHDRQAQAERFLQELAQKEANARKGTFTFACPIWKSPWMWCGGDTYVSDLIRTAGGSNVAGKHLRYPAIDLDEVLALRPDVVFLPDEPYPFTEDDVAAFEGARVIGPFPGHLFTWHGVRTIAGLEFLAGSGLENLERPRS